MGNQDVVDRAFAAYSRAGGKQQPSKSRVVDHRDGKRYVVLSNLAGILAIYRVQADGALLRRWAYDVPGGGRPRPGGADLSVVSR